MSWLASASLISQRPLDDTCVQPGYFNEIQIFLAKQTNTPLVDASAAPSSEASEKASSVTSGGSESSFDLVEREADTETGREIRDEGGAGSVNVFEKVAEKL